MHWQTSYFCFYLWISKLCPKKEILARACLIYMLFVASLWCWDPSISFLLMVIYCFDSTMFCSIFLKSSFKFFCFISNFPNDEILLWLSNDLLNFSQIQFFCFISHFPNPTFPYERRWHLIWRSSLPSPHFLMVPIYFLPQFHFFSCIVYSRTNPLTTLALLVLTFETLTELEKI